MSDEIQVTCGSLDIDVDEMDVQNGNWSASAALVAVPAAAPASAATPAANAAVAVAVAVAAAAAAAAAATHALFPAVDRNPERHIDGSRERRPAARPEEPMEWQGREVVGPRAIKRLPVGGQLQKEPLEAVSKQFAAQGRGEITRHALRCGTSGAGSSAELLVEGGDGGLGIPEQRGGEGMGRKKS